MYSLDSSEKYIQSLFIREARVLESRYEAYLQMLDYGYSDSSLDFLSSPRGVKEFFFYEVQVADGSKGDALFSMLCLGFGEDVLWSLCNNQHIGYTVYKKVIDQYAVEFA